MILLTLAAGSSSGGGYTMYVIFDDAGNMIISENVIIDGVKVGTIESTSEGKASVTLHIANPGFQTSAPTPPARSTHRR